MIYIMGCAIHPYSCWHQSWTEAAFIPRFARICWWCREVGPFLVNSVSKSRPYKRLMPRTSVLSTDEVRHQLARDDRNDSTKGALQDLWFGPRLEQIGTGFLMGFPSRLSGQRRCDCFLWTLSRDGREGHFLHISHSLNGFVCHCLCNKPHHEFFSRMHVISASGIVSLPFQKSAARSKNESARRNFGNAGCREIVTWRAPVGPNGSRLHRRSELNNLE